MIDTNEQLTHYGVKGMKWGKRLKTRVSDQVNSMAREASWRSELSRNKSTADLNKVANRVQLENDFKRLSKKSGIGGKEAKAAYLKRDRMSDKDLNDTVAALRARDNMSRVATDATRSQIDTAKRYAKAFAPVLLKVAITKTLTPMDIAGALAKAAMGENTVNRAKSGYDEVRKLKNK